MSGRRRIASLATMAFILATGMVGVAPQRAVATDDLHCADNRAACVAITITITGSAAGDGLDSPGNHLACHRAAGVTTGTCTALFEVLVTRTIQVYAIPVNPAGVTVCLLATCGFNAQETDVTLIAGTRGKTVTMSFNPAHGYEVIQELEAQSGGRWRPSAGSVYPTLQQLADEGLVTSTEVDGRRTYTLSEQGQKVAAETGGRSPWTESESDDQPDVMRLAMQLAGAVVQVQKLGSPRARGEASAILTDARKKMYRLLSEDEDASSDGESDGEDESAPA